MRRCLPCYSCRDHRFVAKDLVVYGYRVYVRWSGEGFGDCNDVLFLPERLRYSVLFAPSERLPVVVAVLYSKPDIVERVGALVVRDVQSFIECVFRYAEVFARDVVALDYVPRTKGFLDRQGELPAGPVYEVSTDAIFRDMLRAVTMLCDSCRDQVSEVLLGPEIEKLEKRHGLVYAVDRGFMYLHDGVNHVFIDIRAIDPFEVGEDNIVVAYGIYGHREEAYACFIGEEVVGEDMLREVLSKPIVREDGRLRGVRYVVQQLVELIEGSST